MAIDVNGVEVIDNNQKGKFKGVNVGTSVPASATTGDVYFNSSTDTLQVFDGSTWRPVSGGEARTTAAQGGAISYSSSKVTHIFSSSGAFKAFKSIPGADVFCVGGGGGGGTTIGGGGGAGGVRYTNTITIASGTYPVYIGAGGGPGASGGKSEIAGITSCKGGGRGGPGPGSGAPGGSGGGGGHGGDPNGTRSNKGSGTPGEGNNGGNGGNNGMSVYMGGGGGGAAGVGSDVTRRPIGQGVSISGYGGSGIYANMTGSTNVQMVAGGGGGGNNRPFGPIGRPGYGSPYGGGNGGDPSNYYGTGTLPGYSAGSGGGGAGQGPAGAGRGQAGIIYVRYPISSL